MRQRFNGSYLVADWYEVKKLGNGLYCVDEQDHVAFYVLKNGDKGLLIDSGLGLVESKAKTLFEALDIKDFDVLATHAHCDHSGLNYLAKNVKIFKAEWTKYLDLGEEKQIDDYYEMLKDKLPWPKEMAGKPVHRLWKPTSFISEGERVSFGKLKLEALFLPGHTRGHLVFIEWKENIVFLGDFCVTGTNFIHLKDSSIINYVKSLKKLGEILGKLNNPMLLPCHDQIPLDGEYIFKILDVIKQIKSDALKPKKKCEGDSLFEEAWLYDTGDVRILVRADQIEQLKESRI